MIRDSRAIGDTAQVQRGLPEGTSVVLTGRLCLRRIQVDLRLRRYLGPTTLRPTSTEPLGRPTRYAHSL